MLSSKDKNLVFVQTKEIIGLKKLKVDDKQVLTKKKVKSVKISDLKVLHVIAKRFEIQKGDKASLNN